MKNTLLKSALCAAIVLAATTSQAKIWRLNNNGNGTTPVITASFPSATTLQQAHDNAGVLAGDTIHVEQSPLSYGDCIFTKKLTLIGAGYFLDKNPNTQVNTGFGSPVGSLTLKTGTCAGSTITGLTVNGTVALGSNNLICTRNNFIGVYGINTITVGAGNATAIDNITISQNYVVSSYGASCVAEEAGTTGNVSNVTISNNLLNSAGQYASTVVLTGRESGILKNNLMLSSGFGSGGLTAFNMYVVNNISVGTGTYTFNNSMIEYNLATVADHFTGAYAGTNNTAGPGNVVNATPGFITSTSTDGMYALLAGSPAKGTGKSGEDMGIFGGTLPYKLSGIPTVPNIYALTIAPIAAGATTISVTVSTKSN